MSGSFLDDMAAGIRGILADVEAVFEEVVEWLAPLGRTIADLLPRGAQPQQQGGGQPPNAQVLQPGNGQVQPQDAQALPLQGGGQPQGAQALPLQGGGQPQPQNAQVLPQQGGLQPRQPAAVTINPSRMRVLAATLDAADGYVNGPLPTGGWASQQFGGVTGQVSKSGDTVRIGKQEMWLSPEQMQSANQQLETANCALRLEAVPDDERRVPALEGKETFVQVRPALRLKPDGPDKDLAGRLENGEVVSYADCHRNAVVAAGYDYDPASDGDVERLVIDGQPVGPGAKIDRAIRDADWLPEQGNVMKYTSHVGERTARAVIDGGLQDLVKQYPELAEVFDTLDAKTQARVARDYAKVPKDDTDPADQHTLIANTKATWNKYAVLSAASGQDLGNPKASARDMAVSGLMDNLDMDEQEANDLMDKVPPGALDHMSKALGINQYCKPKPGEVLTMVSGGASDLWSGMDNEHTQAELSKRKVEHAVNAEHVAAKYEKLSELTGQPVKGLSDMSNAEVNKLFRAHKEELDKITGPADEPDANVRAKKRYAAQLEKLSELSGLPMSGLLKLPDDQLGPLLETHKDALDQVPMPAATAQVLNKHLNDMDVPGQLEPWNMHWANVAMTDGEDVVTFENFSVEMHSAINDKWIFGTYGDKSFYDESMSSGFFGPSAMALSMTKNA